MIRLSDPTENKAIAPVWADPENVTIASLDPHPRRIEFLQTVVLGGVPQAIHVHGEDAGLPLLLFLHGGPGLPHMPFAHVNADLARWFLVVNWDQRGAGKSYSPSLRGAHFSAEQFVSDTHDLILWLLERFGKSRLVLAGHSWGSALGAIVASRYPHLVAAFVGLGQVTNLRVAEQMRFQMARTLAREQQNRAAADALATLGPPPYRSARESDALERWTCRLTGDCHCPIEDSRFLRLALLSPVYSWLDLLRIPLGVRLSGRCFWEELFHGIDLFSQVPKLDVPAFFIVGRNDAVVTHGLVRRYFETLVAPRGKSFITFDHSGHWPQLEEPGCFRSVLTGPVWHGLRHGFDARSFTCAGWSGRQPDGDNLDAVTNGADRERSAGVFSTDREAA
ncbi:alpha/beta fold hydrolase [Opitutus terrae]|nr:alpha/beta hydrolase [Opitutus terrae]